jgi:O-antigen ligase
MDAVRRRRTAVAVAALIAILAMALALRGFSAGSLACVHIPLWLVLGLASWRAYPGGLRIPIDAMTVGMALLAVWLGITRLASPVANIATHGLFLLGTLPLCCLLYHCLDDGESVWRGVSRGIVGIGLILAVWGLIEINLFGTQSTSVFVQTNSHAAFLDLAAVPYVAAMMSSDRFWRARPLSRVLLFMPLFVLLLAVASGLGRGALLGFLIATGIVLVRGAEWFGRGRSAVIASMIVIAFALAGALNHWALPKRVLGGVEVALTRFGIELEAHPLADPGKGASSLYERFLIWRSTWHMLRDAPWYGRGLGTFHQFYPAYRDDQDTSAGQYAHNDVLQFAYELGYPGVLILLWLAAGATIATRRIVTSASRPPAERLEALGLAGALFATAVHSLFSYNLYILPILIVCGWMLGRLGSMAAAEHRSVLALSFRRVFGPMAFRLAVVLATAIPVSVLAAMLGMEVNYERARQHMLAGRLGDAERALARAERLFNTEAIHSARTLLCSEAMALAAPGDPSAELRDCAVRSVAAGKALNPYNPEVHYREARLYHERREQAARDWFRRAELAYARALDRDSRHHRARLGLALLLEEAGRVQLARGLLETGLQFRFEDDPGEVLPYARTLRRLRAALGYDKEAQVLDERIRELEDRWRAADVDFEEEAGDARRDRFTRAKS